MSSVDLVLLRQTDPALIARIVRELGEALRGGDLPPLPVTTHPVTEAAEPFHTMAAARHTGKLVLTWPTEGTTTLPVDPEDVEVVRTDGTYLVTGGLGGLGLLLARRLADLGASAIVLNSRSEPDEDTRTVIEELRATGTRVEVVSGDISAAGVVAEAVTAAKACGHPLRGVVHAAAVVEDAIATNIDPALLDRVWTPKATGAWRLHEATAGLPELDWWAVFSSESSLLGRPGQGSYAAANAWLDEFAAWRRAQGLPAVSINWGGWAEHGRGAYNEQLGYTMIRPAEGLAAAGEDPRPRPATHRIRGRRPGTAHGLPPRHRSARLLRATHRHGRRERRFGRPRGGARALRRGRPARPAAGVRHRPPGRDVPPGPRRVRPPHLAGLTRPGLPPRTPAPQPDRPRHRTGVPGHRDVDPTPRSRPSPHTC